MSAAAPAPVLLLLDIGPWEFLVIAALAVMLFGGDLPDVMRRAGRFVAKLRGMAEEIGRSASLPEDLAQLPRDDASAAPRRAARPALPAPPDPADGPPATPATPAAPSPTPLEPPAAARDDAPGSAAH